MIFKNKFPNAPDVSVLLSGVSVDYTSVQTVTIDIAENKHDMATIEFVGLLPKAITDYVGAPVFISISVSPAQITSFYGYVTYVEPEMITRKGLINNSPVQAATVVCFGSSYDMSNTKNKVWENVTLPNIVETFANAYNYSYCVPDDRFVWNRLLQNQQSDWAFLAETASSIGYLLVTNGTHLNLYDPYKAIGRKLPYVELLTVRGALGDLEYVPGRIMEFTGTFGDVTPDGDSNRHEYIGIDSSGRAIKSTTSNEIYSQLGEAVPSRYTTTVNTNVSSIGMLNKFADGAIRMSYPYNAKVTVTGIPDPIPGSIAKIDNYDSNFDGYWLVRAVKHTVTRSNFLTELTISTDSTNGKNPEVRPVAAYNVPPNPVLINGIWSSSRAFGDVYV
jgi:phage protein D